MCLVLSGKHVVVSMKQVSAPGVATATSFTLRLAPRRSAAGSALSTSARGVTSREAAEDAGNTVPGPLDAGDTSGRRTKQTGGRSKGQAIPLGRVTLGCFL